MRLSRSGSTGTAGHWAADGFLYVETFFLAGLLLGFEALQATDYARFPGDYVLLLAGIALGHALIGAALGLPAAVAGARLRRRGGRRRARAVRFFHGLACGMVLLLPQFLLFWIEWDRPVSLKDRYFQAGFLLEAVIAMALAMAIARGARTVGGMRTLRRSLHGATLAASLLLFAAVPVWRGLSASRAPGETPPAAVEIGRRVVVVGLDGADWSVIDRLGKAGRLPNLTRLAALGASGPLESIVSELTPFADISSGGMRSNVVWTSIATGKTPRKHGIHDFLFTRIAGLEHPFPARLPFFEVFKRVFRGAGASCVSYGYPTRLSRRCRALWNIAGDVGRRVAVIGWWVTRPAERVNGWMIADRPYDRESIYPQSERLQAALAGYQRGMEDRASRIARFTTYPYDPGYADRFDPGSHDFLIHDSLDQLARDFVFDEIKARLAVAEVESGDADLVMLYFFGPDNAEHYFWKYYDPAPFGDVPPEDVDRFGGIIEAYYTYIDSVVGVIRDRADDDTVLLLCSDHGMGPWTDDRKGIVSRLLAPSHQVNSGNHRREGIIILQGDGIQKGAKLKGASVLDIAPTVLALLGLPVARDFDGRVLDAAFTPAFRKRFPPRSIESYEGGGEGEGAVRGEAGTGEDLDRLRALGYIE